MELKTSQFVKSYVKQGLDYYYLTQASPCINVIATPLQGDACVDVSLVDFGPILLIKRTNDAPAIEEYRFSQHVMAMQLPTANDESIDAFQRVLGGHRHSPFLTSGAKAQWIVPEKISFYQLHIDARWLKKVLGPAAMEDYLELSLAPSRKAYDRNTLFEVSDACEVALNMGLAAHSHGESLSPEVIVRLAKNIILPCITSELIDVKSAPRQKILSRALDYIHEHYASPISSDTLADVAATSVRNLQMVFKHELGVSPVSYIHQFRLHRFRHALSVAASVTEAAYASGFKHLGRLTERYAQVFNQKPSYHLSGDIPKPLDLGDPSSLEWATR